MRATRLKRRGIKGLLNESNEIEKEIYQGFAYKSKEIEKERNQG